MNRVWIRFDSMKDEMKGVQGLAGRAPILGRRMKEYAISPEHLPFLESLGALFYVTEREGDGAPDDTPAWLTQRGGASEKEAATKARPSE